MGAWWALEGDELARRLGSGPSGLSSAEAAARLERHGTNELHEGRKLTGLGVLLRQLRSPLLALLLFAALASGLSGEWIDAGIVIVIVAVSVALGGSREYKAERAAAALRARVQVRTTVLRDGAPAAIPSREIVPGDMVLLAAGSLVPADLRIVEAADCFVNEAILTGESFPVEKRAAPVAADTAVAARASAAFLGSNVRSGTARGLVIATAGETQYGEIAARLATRAPETDFDRSLRHFGYLLTTAMMVVVLVVFAANVVLGRPAIETLLFSIALAVGISPELLPVILGINLARGAQLMARHGVLVRHLNAIENLGSMDVLCTDKTGTLTEGVVELEGAYDADGASSVAVRALAVRNAALQTGLPNPLDQAIVTADQVDLAGVEKVAEIPYDFIRKRLAVIVRERGDVTLISKGAFESVLSVCRLDDADRDRLRQQYLAWTSAGIRVLGVATRRLDGPGPFGREDERELTFVGFLTFFDRPKDCAARAIAELVKLGVSIKVITGDSKLVAQHVAQACGLRHDRTLTGRELDELHHDARWRAADETDVFAEVDPNQKEQIIRALRRGGHVVGFLGDGVNDAPAMHAADTSISVESAVDVAKEAADFVLLERDLDVVRRGVVEGRRTFANTLKYVLTTTSANLGNMLSMALASLVLPFLPLTAGQVLLNNFLSDIPALGIADDHVDPEALARPPRWSMRFIGRFMVQFGALSSLFDVLTFVMLLGVFAAGVALFRTGWFVESLLTELAIALVVRTRRPLHQSRPGRLLLVSTLVLIPVAVAIPFLPYADVFGFVPLRPLTLAALLGITALYIAAAELLKRRFFARELSRPRSGRQARDGARTVEGQLARGKTFGVSLPPA